jgi:triosephosphate isomerase (TIM)
MGGHRKLIIGNWKMHFTVKQAVSFAEKLASKKVPEGITVVAGPHTLALHAVAEKTAKSDLEVAAQNAYFQDEGAFTGEISMPMLRGLAGYVLIGHSERRHIFHESHELIRHKVAAAMRSEITPVFCVGETLVEHEHYHTNQVLNDQLTTGLADLTSEEVAKVVIAYEPVWAIGTGKFAGPDEVESAVNKIRQVVGSLYGSPVAEKVQVLYGGSVSPDNAKAYLDLEGINGLLVGGASLSLHTFWPIVEKAAKTVPKKIEVKK